MYIRKIFLGTFLILTVAPACYGQQASQQQAITKTLDTFHQAIIDNDTQTAETILSDSARILEGGNIETKKEYLSHHFHSDGKFLSSMKREVESRTVTFEGKTAWVSTEPIPGYL